MKNTKRSSVGQNIMSFRGLQLVQERRRPFITLSSIRNLSTITGEILKDALKCQKIRTHRIFISWGMREFHTTCIRLQDLDLLNQSLQGAIPPDLITEINKDYRNII